MDFVQERLLNEPLVQQERVVVHDIDKVGTRGGAGRAREFFGGSWIPERDLIYAHTLDDELLRHAPAANGRISWSTATWNGAGLDAANVA